MGGFVPGSMWRGVMAARDPEETLTTSSPNDGLAAIPVIQRRGASPDPGKSENSWKSKVPFNVEATGVLAAGLDAVSPNSKLS